MSFRSALVGVCFVVLASCSGGDDDGSPDVTPDAGKTVDPDAGTSPPALEIVTTTLPNARVKDAYEATVEARGGTSAGYTWSVVAGALPDGLALTSGQRATIAGTPTDAASVTFTIRVTDDGGAMAEQELTIVVDVVALTIVGTLLANGSTVRWYQSGLTASGGVAPLTWRFAGTLPPGLMFATNEDRYELTGIPEAAGTYDFTVHVDDSTGIVAFHAATVTVVDDAVGVAPTTNWTRDIAETRLDLCAQTGTASAQILVGPSTEDGMSFESNAIRIRSVRTDAGYLAFTAADRRLDVGLAASSTTTTLTIEYALRAPIATTTTFFPNLCGNGFPCRSAPSEGSRYWVDLRCVPAGRTAVSPAALDGQDAMAYQVSWTVDDLTYRDLGTTVGGVEVGVYFTSGQESSVDLGTTYSLAATEWMEQMFGPYPWGDRTGTVVTNRTIGALETHPFAVIGPPLSANSETYVHEMVHGWFGTTVRFGCWEDALLSEGTTTYLAARAIEAVGGTAAGDAVWASYRSSLTSGEITWTPPLGSACRVTSTPGMVYTSSIYFRTAEFYRAVENRIGRATIDAALVDFYRTHRGGAPQFADMLDTIDRVSGWNPAACARKWLSVADLPTDGTCL